MKITTRLSFQFTFIVLGLLLFFSVLVYYFFHTSQITKFRGNLLEKAQNSAILLINVEEVDSVLLKKIHQTTISLKEEEIAIINQKEEIIYQNNLMVLSADQLPAMTNGPVTEYFSLAHKDGVIYKHFYKGEYFKVYVLAFDENRRNTLNELFKILIIGILTITGLAISASFFFSRLAIAPISKINSEVKKINYQKLSSRLETGSGKDEIEQLATTFNQMLTDIELAFKSQDDFVKNTSHELRTPLAVMIAETDYLLSKARENEEYEKHLSRLSADLHKINALISNLLELAQMNRDNSFNKTLVRADEVVFSAIHSVKTKYPTRKIIPKIDYTENDRDLLIEGNSGLLEMAIKNLVENACKFSDNQIEIKIELVPGLLKISITDTGIGIPADDIQHIFKPFNRGSNSRYISGFGIGLSIVEKIVHLHQGEIKVSSTENEGSTFEITFNRFANI